MNGNGLNRQDAKNAKNEPDEELNRLAHTVIGAAIEVHRTLGPGFLESVYEQAMAIELRLRNLHFVKQPTVEIEYKGELIGEGRLDFIVEKKLVLELKVVEDFAPIHTAQVISYLKSTHLKLGLLVNFNVPVLKEGIKRIVLSKP